MKLVKITWTAIAFFILYQGVHHLISPNKSAASQQCTVVKGSVYDGDTIRVNCQGQQVKVRFACIDSPEAKQENGIASRDHLRSLLNRSNNQVTIDPITTDRFGRTVAEVYANGQLVQLQQVKAGTVWAYERYKSDCPSWSEIDKAFQEARAASQSPKGAQRKGIFIRGNAIASLNELDKSIIFC